MSLTHPPLERLLEPIVARLSKTLAEFGVDEDPDAFVDRLADVFHRMFPAFTIDELLVRPRQALRFCDGVRETLGNYDNPDDILLRPLLNRRKHG